MCILDFQQCRHHAALPIMGMDNIRLEIQHRQCVEYPAAEEAEPFILISAKTVNVGAAKVVLVVHEVPGHAILFQLFNTAILSPPPQLHFKVAHMGHFFRPLGGNSGIQRQNNAYIMALRSQHRRQCTYHIRQTASFDKRHTLACRKQNLHKILLPVSFSPSFNSRTGCMCID